jgi:hypothetical protein
MTRLARVLSPLPIDSLAVPGYLVSMFYFRIVSLQAITRGWEYGYVGDLSSRNSR